MSKKADIPNMVISGLCQEANQKKAGLQGGLSSKTDSDRRYTTGLIKALYKINHPLKLSHGKLVL